QSTILLTLLDRIAKLKPSTLRNLLKNAGKAPWSAYAIMRHPGSPTYIVDADGEYVGGRQMGDGVVSKNRNMITAAQLLAQKLLFLYIREPEEQKYEIHEVKNGLVYDVENLVAIDIEAEYYTPDEAVDIARALLDSAERALNSGWDL